MAARTVAFLNFKGGVGKTAMTVNLAACLTAFHNQRVLVVDLDPQCNSSFWLLHPAACQAHTQDGEKSTYQIFQDQMVGTQRFQFDEAVVPGVPRRDYPLLPQLDLLPASIRLIQVEDRIYQQRGARFFEYLYQALRPVRSRYDFIFLDCPPNTYAVTKNALYAADFCVVPYIPDFLSLSGLQILAEQIEAFNERVSGFKQGRKPARIGALVVSHYRNINAFKAGVDELANILAQLRAQDRVHPRARILEPYVRNCAAVAESTGEHLPVILHDNTCIGAEDYYHLASSFLAQAHDL